MITTKAGQPTKKASPKSSVSFAAKSVTKDLLASLPARARRVLNDRFGLQSGGKGRTLEAIGKEYGITRERIRQIESSGIASVRDSGIAASRSCCVLKAGP